VWAGEGNAGKRPLVRLADSSFLNSLPALRFGRQVYLLSGSRQKVKAQPLTLRLQRQRAD